MNESLDRSKDGLQEQNDLLPQAKDSKNLQEAKWLNNQGEEVEKVFGFNQNAELVNGRAAMFGFLMLIITEIVFNGEAATHSLFGLG